MSCKILKFATDVGARAILKAAPRIHALFGSPDHYYSAETPLLYAVTSQSSSTSELVYPPRWYSSDLIEEGELLRLREEQDHHWRQEHAEREASLQELPTFFTEPAHPSYQHIRQPRGFVQDQQVPIWQQRDGVLQQDITGRHIQVIIASGHPPKSRESTLFTFSDTDTHSTTEESTSQPVRIPKRGCEDDMNGYAELRTDSSSSSSLRRHDAVRYRLNPLFYRDMLSSASRIHSM
ncbi:Nn.00g096870.m01.CDS01 [Neocucurbitaria sp. VM-36]